MQKIFCKNMKKTIDKMTKVWYNMSVERETPSRK